MLTLIHQDYVDRARANLAQFNALPPAERGGWVAEFCGVFSVNVDQLLEVIGALVTPEDEDDAAQASYEQRYRPADADPVSEAQARHDLARRILDDPPEYVPDDGEAQRIAEVYADAKAELDRGL